LTSEQQELLRQKVEKLVRYFGRLMSIQVAVERRKNDWEVEILASAEHKHDFVAVEHAPQLEAAADLCIAKIEGQLRRYKEKVQEHRDNVPHGGTPFVEPDEPSEESAAD
jgi:putative sigma-54 modulation protein